MRRLKVITTLLVSSLLCMATCFAQTRAWRGSEKQLKAAMLLNFLRFTEFPTAPAQRTICVLGDNPFESALKGLEKQKVKGKPLKTRVVSSVEEVTDSCQLLFISSNLKPKLKETLKKLRDFEILTVGEMEDFAQKGGMVNLVNVGSTVRFRINHNAAKAQGVSISSRLLRIATVVETE